MICPQLQSLAVPIADLVPDPENAREHNADNIRAIAASLRKFGQLKPIIAHRETHRIEAGNGTLRAAQSLGWTELAVVWVDHDQASATGFAIADNRTAELATWNVETLMALAEEMETSLPDLYEDLLLAELVTRQPEDDAEPVEQDAGPTFVALVECADSEDLKRFTKRMEREGRTVRTA